MLFPCPARAAPQGEDVEIDQPIRLVIIKAQENPFRVPLAIGLRLHPALPLAQDGVEVAVLNQQQPARLQAGGISLYDYLVQMGEQDVEAEIQRIQADRKQAAELEIEKAIAREIESLKRK